MKIQLRQLDSATKQEGMDKNKNLIESKDKDADQLRNTCSLMHIYNASIFLKTTLNDVRYQLAQQFVSEVQSDPPSVLNSYICVHIIVGQLEFHRNYLSAINIVFMYYWDVIRKDNIINKVLVDLNKNFQKENPFIRETIIRADKCLKRIEKEMTAISGTIKWANVIIWRYCEELNQIKLWSIDQNNRFNKNKLQSLS